MKEKEKIERIDLAINEVLKSLEDGVGIKEYSIDGITIKKQSPLEIINELSKMKAMIKQKSYPHSVQYRFGRG